MLLLAVNMTATSCCTTLNKLSAGCLICLITIVILFCATYEMLEYIHNAY